MKLKNSKKTFLIGLVIASANIALTPTIFADTSREMESVLTITADSAAMLLSNDDIMLVSHETAASLLGDGAMNAGNTDPSMALDQINSMPATAAGMQEIFYMDSDSAEDLLGDN